MDVKVLSQGRQNLYDITNNNSLAGENSNVNTSLLGKNLNDSKNDNLNAVDGNKEVKQTTDKIKKIVKGKSTHIEYEQDKRFKYVMVMKVIDNNTHQEINRIPSKQILDLIAEFCGTSGLLLNKRA